MQNKRLLYDQIYHHHDIQLFYILQFFLLNDDQHLLYHVLPLKINSIKYRKNLFFFLLTVGSCPPNSDSKSSSIIPSDDIVPLINPRFLFEFDAISLSYTSI